MKITLLLALLALHAQAAGAADKRPNVLMVVADDLGFSDVDFQMPNSSIVKTPNLRYLAHNGVVFGNMHVQPFCSPTRAALQTGRHVLRYGLSNTVIWPQDAWALPENETFISQNFKDLGYYTAQYGKWHLGFYKEQFIPGNRGYDEQYGYYLGGEDYVTHVRDGGLDWHRNGTLETGDNGTYSADLLSNATVDFIHRRAEDSKPWFLYLPFQSVHSPMEATEECLKQYPDQTGNVKVRAAMVCSLDAAMGNIIDALEAANQMDDTIIFFTADNGAPYGDAFSDGDDPAMMEAMGFGWTKNPSRPPSGMHGPGGGSNHPFSGWKHWVFEGGVRSASFLYAKKLITNPGIVHDGLFHVVDILPTLMHLVGGSTTRNLPLDGFNIWPAIQAGSGSPRTEIPVNIAACGHKEPTIVDGPQTAMIVGDLKLIVDCYWRDTKPTSIQLYNITADLAEEEDLSKERPDDVTRLMARLAFWEQQAVGPYVVEKGCGEGKPKGNPPHWDFWC